MAAAVSEEFVLLWLKSTFARREHAFDLVVDRIKPSLFAISKAPEESRGRLMNYLPFLMHDFYRSGRSPLAM